MMKSTDHFIRREEIPKENNNAFGEDIMKSGVMLLGRSEFRLKDVKQVVFLHKRRQMTVNMPFKRF